MSRNLERRVQALEASDAASFSTRVEAEFWAAVHEAAGNIELNDRGLTLPERIARYTPLEHLAWQIKMTGEADLDVVLPLYGMGGQADMAATEMQKWSGWVLLMNWMPGD
jgi:hypothetical protein